ncbi:MAG: hypothetical protein ACR2NA_10360 [Solirubrobacterales bacterium]
MRFDHDAWTQAAANHAHALQDSGRRSRRPAARPSIRTVVVSASLLALLVAPLALAQDDGRPTTHSAAISEGDALRAEIRNGTTGKETEIIGEFNQSTGSKGGYVTRQSNTKTGSKAGGAAIYGCRGAAGGTASGSAPCLRANNLGAGYAFEFATKTGNVGGLIDVGAGGDAKKPLTTNATGVATGLNADRLDGRHGSQFLSDIRYISGSETTVPANSSAAALATCPSGFRAIGGGNQDEQDGSAADFAVTESQPLTTGSAWQVIMRNDSATPRRFTPKAACVSSGS